MATNSNPLLAEYDRQKSSNPLLEEFDRQQTAPRPAPAGPETAGRFDVKSNVARAQSGQAERDFAEDGGFWNRAGDLAEKGLASMQAGLQRIEATINPFEVYRDQARERARALEKTAGTNITGTTDWEAVKAKPTIGKVGKFIVEQGIQSAPEMAFAALPGGLVTQALTQTGRIGQDRAQNDGREDASIGDLGIGAAFGIPTAMLERVGIKGILSGKGKSVTGRIVGATAKEGGTEFAQSILENTGGSLGTQTGFDPAQALDEGFAGAVAGAGMGAGLRTGGEVIDASGRLIKNRVRRPVAPGEAETAIEGVEVNQGDIDSPLDTQTILQGKMSAASAAGQTGADSILTAAGMPKTGTLVDIDTGDGIKTTGTIEDAFNVDGAAGINIRLPDGTLMRENFDDLVDAGVTITPASYEQNLLAQADAIDAGLTEQIVAANANLSPGSSFETNININGQNTNVQGNIPPTTVQGNSPGTTSPVAPTTFALPVQGKITSGFGNRKSPLPGASKDHNGIDIASPVGTPVAAPARGKVIASGYNKKAGNFVRIDHGNGVITGYAHLNARGPRVGTVVEAGDSFAESGNTGNSTGPHLHYTMRVNGKSVDPRTQTTLEAGGIAGGGAAVTADGTPTQYTDIDKTGFKAANAQPIERGAPIRARTDEKVEPAVTATGKQVNVRYAVAELDDLVASNDQDGRLNPAYPQALQPRDRQKGTSQAQINNIFARFNPLLLGRTAMISDGAPMIGADGVVESGNGRVLALNKVYDLSPEKAAAYKEFIETQGVSAEGFSKPVLVRIREDGISDGDLVSLLEDGNKSNVMDMSAPERGLTDSRALSSSVLARLKPGSLNSADNTDFVRSFFRTVANINDLGTLVAKDGTMAKPALDRINAALLTRAYNDSALLEKALVSTDENTSAIITALTKVAGEWAQMVDAVENGQVDPDINITANLAEAVQIVEQARSENHPVSDLVTQNDIFLGKTLNPVTAGVLRLFFARADYTKPLSSSKIAKALSFYVQEAMKTMGSVSLLDADTNATPAKILDLAREKQGYEQPGQSTEAAVAAESAADREGGANEASRQDAPEPGRNDERPAGESVPEGTSQEDATRLEDEQQLAESSQEAAPGKDVERDYAPRDEAPSPTSTEPAPQEPQEAAAPAPETATEPAPSIAGESLGGGWTAFTAESGTLNIPRDDMPQIKAENRGAMVNFLGARNIASEEETVPSASLKPTQAEFSKQKVLKAKNYKGGDRAILVSADSHVVDGHHQWLASRDKGENIRIIRLDAPIREIIELVKEMPSTETAGGDKAQPTAGPRVLINRVGKDGLTEQERKVQIASNPGDLGAQVDAFMIKAQAAQDKLESLVSDLPGWQTPGIKKRARIIEKIEREDYAGPDALKDTVRGAIIVKNAADARRVERAIMERFTVVQDKQWKMLPSGYIDHKFIVDIDGVKAEIQVVPDRVWSAKKDGGAGDLYDQERVSDDPAEKDALNAQMREIYAAALEGSDFNALILASKSAMSASGNSRTNNSREPMSSTGVPSGTSNDLTASPGANPQRNTSSEPSRQTNAIPEGPGLTMQTGRPSIDPNEGNDVAISPDNIGTNDEKSNNDYGAKNKTFTASKKDEYLAKLKAASTRLNSGFDPELAAAGLYVMGYHIEAGARSFIDASRAVAADLGMTPAQLKNSLRSWYSSARIWMEDNGEDTRGMDDDRAVAVDLQRVDQWGGEVSTNEPEPATERVEDGFQNDLFAGDAGPGTANAEPAPENGGDGIASGDEVQGSARPVRSDNQQGGEVAVGRGEGSANRPDSGAASDINAGRVPAGRDPSSSIKGRNWSIEPGSLDEGRSPAVKARDNLAAIEIVKELDKTGAVATAAQQAAIAKYVGWGGLKNAFADPQGQYGKGFEDVGPRLRELLTDEEYDTARRSIQYAHYTGETVVRSMWNMAQRLGFKGGNIFEPGMGTGNFAGMMPPALAGQSRYQGIEYDHLTSRIAYHLYPEWGVRQDDYTRMPKVEDAYDLVIGNPPFSQTTISSDPAYAAEKFVLHDYFFAKSLDAVRPGGLLMFVTSAGTMNKVGTKAREYLADRADLVGAVRLPGNAFEKNAGTSVTTDIVILRKRLEGEAPAGEAWIKTVERVLPTRDGGTKTGQVSEYFSSNPDMVLGEEGFFYKLVAGERYAVRAPKGFDLQAALADVAKTLPQNVMSQPDETLAKAAKDFDLSATERKEGSFYMADGKLMQLSGGVGRPVQSPGKGVKGGVSKAGQERIKRLIPVRDALREVYHYDLAGDTANAEKARKALNRDYDTFVNLFGPINKANFTYRRPSIVQQESARMQAREDARLADAGWDDGSFNIDPYLARGAKITEIARARADAREAAQKNGTPWSEGSFDPAEMADIVIDKRPNIEAFMSDQEGYRLRAIEKYNDDTGTAKKTGVFFENVIALEQEPQINSVQDALLYSLNKKGFPDIDLIAEQSGLSRKDAIEQLGADIFEIPGKAGSYQSKELYLSGNIREKLEQAKAGLDRNPALQRNIDALEEAMPLPLSSADIVANLGMPWLPPKTIEEFGKDRLGLERLNVKYVPKLAQWQVGGDTSSAAATTKWGTPDFDAPTLISNALNRITPKKFDNVSNGDGGTRQVLNETATQAAQDKVLEIKEAFREWVWNDPAREADLVDQYNRDYNSHVAPQYDGSYLKTPGIASFWKWRPHQAAVVARVIQSGNTYMAHEVGAGKTSAMIGAGMEMRRLGLKKKPMYVVPNHMLGQFTKEFYEQYPTARIAVADEKRFHTSSRKQFIANVAQDDLDAVIITHSAFGFISVSNEFSDSLINEQVQEFRDLLNEIPKDQENRFTRRRIEQQIEQLEQRLSGKANSKADEVLTFEEMGIDQLFIDEAHLFRKLDFATKMGSVKGIDSSGSKMAFDLFTKIRYLESKTPGRSLVLASGTPITNTMAELYSLSRYLQLDELQKRGLEQFDAWAGAFGDTAAALEQDPAGGYKTVTRFSKFVNVPELSVMVRQVMDVVTAQDLRRFVTLPVLKGGKRNMVVVEQTKEQKDYQAVLKSRMDAIAERTGPPKPGDDILLSVIGDGRKSAIDARLINSSFPKGDSKLERMIENAARIFKESKRAAFHTPEEGGYSKEPVDYGPATQMIFSDFGINGEFPVHKYIQSQLIARGVPKSQVALISDYKTHVAKQRLFNDMNDGKVRILIGSVAKMGTGVNAQKRLIANHNMDPQWYPANDTQRNGRIVRQGNMNPEVEIYDYSTKGTYDSTMWGLMETKGRFIEGFMRGDATMRDMEDLGEASQYEQAKALSTSDPRIMQLTEWKQDLERAQRRKQVFEREKRTVQSRITKAERDIASAEKQMPLIEADIAQRVDITGDKFTAKVKGKTFDKRVDFGEAVLKALDDLEAGREAQDTNSGVIAEFAGFEVVGEAYSTGVELNSALYIKRNGDRETLVNSANTASGVASVLSNAVQKFEGELDNLQMMQEQARKDIAQYTPELDNSFKGQAEIDELRGKVNDLERVLESESAKADANAALKAEIEAGGEVVIDNQAIDQDGNFREAGMGQSIDEQRGGGERASIATAIKTDGFATDLRAQFRKLLPKDKISLRVVDAMLNPQQAGSYTPALKVIRIVENHPGQDASFTLDHEAIHALRDLGLIRDPEWKSLVRRAKGDAALMASIKERYGDESTEIQTEEAVADLFAMWSAGSKQKGFVEAAFNRILSFLSALSSALRGMGYISAEGVMRDIASGKVGQRDSMFISSPSNEAGKMNTAYGSIVDASRANLVASAGTSPFTGKAADLFDRWRTAVQDRYLPLIRTVQKIEQQIGRPLSAEENPYIGEELMTGRIGSKIEKLTDNMVEPLFDAMHREKVDIDELEAYLYARHAPERNARIAEINPTFVQGEGSGMTDIEARAVMNRIQRAGKTEAMQRLAVRVDAIRDMALDMRVASGLISQEEAQSWRDTYADYVPLRGAAEGDVADDIRINRSGGGINVRGKESKMAFGRRSKADSIISYTILQAEEAIVRSETNKVAQQFVELAESSPDPAFWEVNKITSKPVMNKASGLVRYENQTQIQAEDKDYTVTAKFAGVEKRVTMNRRNPAAARLADSMKNLTQHQLDWVTKHLGVINRFLSAVNTSYNPEFVISNAFRDLQTAVVNLAGVKQGRLEAGTLRDYPAALKASVQGAFKTGGGEWKRWYDEFISEGGRVYFNNIESVDGIKKRMRKAFEMAAAKQGSPDARLQVKRGLYAVRDFVEASNLGVENAVRLAAYKNAREAGLSKAQSASIAKNLTVNFNRRGTLGPAINAAYLFFNASMQGSVRIFQAMKSKRVRKILAGVVIGGFMIEMLNAFMSGDDDDGESYYDKLSDFEKSRNLVVMIPGGEGEYIKIPLPYGYNAFFVAGRSMAEIARRGGAGAKNTMANLLSTTVDSFNPVGGTDSLLNFLMPTVADPFVDLERNRNFADMPIMPDENQYGPEEPDAQRYFSSVGPHWRAVTEFLTGVSGGDDILPGAIDVSPETLEHLSGVVLGAAGNFIDRNVGLVGKMLSDSDEVTSNDLPMVRKIYGEKPSWYDKSAFYDRLSVIEQNIDYAKGYMEREEWDRFDTFVDKKAELLSLESDMKAARKEMRGIRKMKRENDFAYEMEKIDDETYRGERDVLSDAEDIVIKQFNTRWNEVMLPGE